jgi:D-xylose 1-dehydrogenase (NADP+, D-xylono-1,5-lactone-forming)
VRWGVLSTARINRKVIPGLQAAGEVVAIASRDADRAAATAREFGIPGVHSSYEALLADGDVEAVYIPLPNSLHVPWTVRALEAGRHVLCEKPLGRHAAAVEEAFAVAEAHGRVLMEAFMYRHHPQIERLLELVGSGRIGALRAVDASFGFNLGTAANIRLDPSLDGGALMDVGCYCLHALRQLGGEPDGLGAVQVTRDGVDITFSAVLRFEGGAVGHFDCGFAQAPRHHLEVVGETGSVRLADPWHGTEPGLELRTGDGVERIEVPKVDPYAEQAAHFAEVAAGEATPRLGAADAIGQARAIEALYSTAGH